MSVNIFIAEDDVFISEHLKQILLDLNHQVTGIVSSYQQAVEFLENNDFPDLALLDIRMHGEDQGVEIAKHLNTLNIPFIYITSFSDKNTVQQAVEQEPKGYIIKPFSKDEIKELVSKIVIDLKPKFLCIKESFMNTKILIEDILYIKSDNVYLEIYTKNKTHLYRSKLVELMDELQNEDFVRVHRSFIINKNFIEKVAAQRVAINGVVIPISKSYKDSLSSFYN